MTENLTKEENKEELLTKFEELNFHVGDIKYLKEKYKAQLRSGSLCYQKGGAGLGFIDIVRKISTKYVYKFEDIENDYVLFTLITGMKITE